VLKDIRTYVFIIRSIVEEENHVVQESFKYLCNNIRNRGQVHEAVGSYQMNYQLFIVLSNPV